MSIYARYYHWNMVIADQHYAKVSHIAEYYRQKIIKGE